MSRRARCLVVGVLLALAAACGDPDPIDPDQGICDGRPCRITIDTPADWAAVAAPHTGDQRCDFLEDAKFIAPATAGTTLTDVVFQDVKAHALHLDFMTQVLPEIFGGLTPQQYQAIVLRRAGRQYWAGSLYRLVDVDGVTTGYGFDVAVDPAYDEQLTAAEIADVRARLTARFHLPLTYAPTTDDAIYIAQRDGIDAHLPRACQYVACPTAGTDCVVVPTATRVCGHFWEGRSLAAELARKVRIEVAAATVELPHAPGVYTVASVFGPGELGPDRVPITPAATARYEVIHHPNDFIQRIYTQAYATPTGPIELRWELYLPETGGGFRLAEPYLTTYFGAILGAPGSTTSDDYSQLNSCAPDSLEPWRARGQLADGGSFQVDFRYQPPQAGSGPLFPVRGTVTLDGATAVVDDYFRLVYAGEHHNWNNNYWVLFAAPLTYRGHAVHGLWIDQAPFASELEAAHTLDAARQPLDLLDVTSYVVEHAP